MIIVVSVGIVADRLAPIAGMKRHGVLRLNIVDGNPPVQLALRRAVPSVTMRMPSIGDASGEIVSTG